MNVLKKMLCDIPLPKLLKVRQSFCADQVSDVQAEVQRKLESSGQLQSVRAGMRVAIAVGSRGIDQLPQVVAAAVQAIKDQGGLPFIVPAMGSHGGATAQGQTAILTQLGISEDSAGCPVRSSLEVTELGRLSCGLPVYFDRLAFQADGIVLINRIKPHTAFHGANESGLVKMLVVGLGKHRGAETYHSLSFGSMNTLLAEAARLILAKASVLFGVGVIENGYDKVNSICVAPAGALIETDQKMLLQAKKLMPRLFFPHIDVLVIDEIGKDISGDGMDPNITGRFPTPFAAGGPQVTKMVVLDLSEKTQGNATGLGSADFTTRRAVKKIDRYSTYVNAMTSGIVRPSAIPVTLDCDRDAIRAAIRTAFIPCLQDIRLVRIENTLRLSNILISECLKETAEQSPELRIVSDPFEFQFDNKGNIKEQPIWLTTF